MYFEGLNEFVGRKMNTLCLKAFTLSTTTQNMQ